MFIIEVFVTNASLNVNKTYSYYYDSFIDNYKRVKVQFNRTYTTALVVRSYEINDLSEYEKELGYKINKIVDIIDEEPIITDNQFELSKWLSKTTISPLMACINTMLPKVLRTSKKIKDSKKIVTINKKSIEGIKLTPKQIDIYNKLTDGMLLSEARKLSVSIVNKLIDLNVLELITLESSFKDNKLEFNNNFKELTPDQRNVYEKVISTDKKVSMLYGVTGSGKTEVYLHLARYYLKQNKEVLILVPEISLTPQMIQRVKERFNDVIFYHSELNDQERYEQYKRVKEGNVRIVVGTRSSIFLPFNNLGLIIIDEEHDTSYKQDNIPCYHAKNIAIKRAYEFNAKVLLGSATPSLDSYTRALKNEYELLELKERINHCLPEIKIVDLTKETKKMSNYIISSELKNELDICINSNKQAIILLNRRGYSPIVKCSSCGTTIMCSDCDVPLNYHSDYKILKCHQCGKTYKTTTKCPKCGENSLIYYGFGTMKVEEELRKLYPNVSIERMDRDNVSKKGAHKDILDRFGNKEIQILIGTQMIAKGLDYPSVTLVGILNADSGLMHQDYNSTKLTLDLLMQASGRSGRADNRGKVIIQAFNTDHYVLKAVLKQDYLYYYNIEMNYREKSMYPPYSHFVQILISDTSDDRLNNSVEYLYEKCQKLNHRMFKPSEINKIQKQKRFRILMFSSSLKDLIEDTWLIVNDYYKLKNKSNIKIDIDSMYLE